MTDGLLTDPPQRLHPGPECGIARAMAALSENDRATLARWLEDSNYAARGIAHSLNVALDTLGERRVSKQIVEHHRRGDCRCQTK